MCDDYSPTSTKLSNLTRYQISAYEESSIINGTDETIIAIDNHNNKTIIPPFEGHRDDCVMVFKRQGVAPTLTTAGIPCSLDGISIKIEKYKFRNNPIYVKELNVVLATEEQALHTVHPFSQATYKESLEACIERLSKVVDDAPSIKLLINDPTNSFEKMYTLLDTNVVSIPVTHDSGDGIRLTILSIREGKCYTDEYDLDVLKSGTTNIVKFKNHVIPWVTTSELNANELAKTFSWITPETLEEFKAATAVETKRTVDAIKATSDAKINDLNVQLTNLNAELKRVEGERDDFKFKYNNIRSDSETQVDKISRMYDMMKAQNDFNTSQGNLQMAGYKLQATQQESQFKMTNLVMAAALPVIAVIGMKMFDRMMNN